MSEPPRWSPPGYGVGPRPTAPYPAAHPPAPEPPTVQFPAVPPATGPYETRRWAAPESPPADRDDYGGAYRDDSGDDSGAYREDRRDAYREDYRSARSRSRGQVFAGVVLLLALMVSVLLGAVTYQMLVSVDLVSADPFAGLTGWMTALAAVALGALVVFVLAMITFVIARPKVLAGMALAASLLLPAGAVVLGVWYGGSVLRQNVENDLAAQGAAVAAEGSAAVDAIVSELERRGLDIGPLRDLIVGIAGQEG
jgi:hypothetical protein